ncbi:MAG: hypothetical protein ABJO27_01310 [Pseudoruegeria sp.]
MKSLLSIWSLASGTASVIFETDRHIEAPNWSPCGNYLLVNGDGQLYRVPLDKPRLTPVDTGFARKLNNDHGFSPDGQHIAISDKTETGKSCIYTLPIQGGAPKRITQNTPSYWHGWSPDGQTLIYPGFRGTPAKAILLSVPAQGGQESCICDSFDHIDGPDYTPNGQWVWFNGERDGTVELWRCQPDGGNLQQMTYDSRINWFPHPSPTGKDVIYLSYAEGTVGHPAEKTVQLRLINSKGGPTTLLCELFGGQGTINVPCWHPNGEKFAFMQYLR